MTLEEAYEKAKAAKKGLIIEGQIGGKCGEQRLRDYVARHRNRDVNLFAETAGYLIVKMRPGKF